MLKYTCSGKINHYFDSGSSEHPQLAGEQRKSSRRTRGKNLATMKISSSIVSRRSHYQSRSLTKANAMKSKPTELAFYLALSTLMICVLLINITGVESLNCYHCSSVDDPGCDESFSSKANYTDTDCSKHLDGDKTAKVCRKIVQFIEQKKVVIRSCGYIDEHDDKEKKPMCYKRSGTFSIMMDSCNCYEDNCNHSAGLVPNQAVMMIALFSLVLVMNLTHKLSGDLQHRVKETRKDCSV